MKNMVSLEDLQAFIARGRAEAAQTEVARTCRAKQHPLTVHVKNLGRCLNTLRCACGEHVRDVDSSD